MNTAIETTSRELTPELLDLMEHEKAIEQGIVGVGRQLMLIRDGEKYRAAGYPSFEAYCRDRWSMAKSHVYRQIDAARTMDAIEATSPIGDVRPVNESQVRPLVPIAREDPAEAADIWNEAVERADGNQPTAAGVAEVVEERRTPKPVPKPAPKVGGERIEGAKPHPAVYSDAVLNVFRALIDEHHWSDGGTICDPFAGTGRIHELQDDDRRTVGVELEPEWAHLHPATICGDSRNLRTLVASSVDVIATSPAYGNRLADSYNAYDPEARRSYSIDLGRSLTDGNGAGLQWGDDYRELHTAVWFECFHLLEPDGLFLLNCKDHQRAGAMELVTRWHVLLLIDLGFTVIDWIPIYPAGLSHTTAAKVAEHVFAFRKPGPISQ